MFKVTNYIYKRKRAPYDDKVNDYIEYYRTKLEEFGDKKQNFSRSRAVFTINYSNK